MFDSYTLKKLIQEHGHDVTLTHVVTGTYDIATGSMGATETPYTVRAYPYQYKLERLRSDSVQPSMLVYVISPTPEEDIVEVLNSYVETSGSFKITDGATYSVSEVDSIKSSSDAMCYKFVVVK